MSRPVKVHFSQKKGKYLNFLNRDLHVIVLHGFLAQGTALNTFSNLLFQRLQQPDQTIKDASSKPDGKWENSLSIFNLDARNHGLSPHTAVHRLPDLVADLTQFLRGKHYTYNHSTQEAAAAAAAAAPSLPPAVLAIGHSMGSGTWTQFLMEQQPHLHPLRMNKQHVACGQESVPEVQATKEGEKKASASQADKMDMIGFVALDMPPIPASQMSETLHTDLSRIVEKMQKMKLENIKDAKSTEAECIRCGICDKRMIGLCTTNISYHKGGGGSSDGDSQSERKMTCTWKLNLPVLAQSLAQRDLFLPESYLLQDGSHNCRRRINVPVLSILGGKSPIGGEKRYQNMFTPFMEKGSFVKEEIILNATHTVYFDKPNETVDAVMRFLESLNII